MVEDSRGDLYFGWAISQTTVIPARDSLPDSEVLNWPYSNRQIVEPRSKKTVSFTKADLNVGERTVLSIEGSALRLTDAGAELFVSTEKSGIDYPTGFEPFLKKRDGGYGQSIVLQAASVDSLNSASIQTVLQSNDPQFVHIKDPFVYQNSDREFRFIVFCSHPFNWSSSNTGYALRCTGESEFTEPVFDFFPRGFTWDVAMTRGTSVVDVPQNRRF